MIYKPKGHEEIIVEGKCITVLILKHPTIEMCGSGEWEAICGCTRVTFNDQYVTYTQKDAGGGRHLNGNYIEVVVPDKRQDKPIIKRSKKGETMNIFEFIGG